ncbi:multidrug efflux pump subunit AcrB [Chitinophaga dinghuensis]|uniref:Multidrug efflux pump subunit AcrB n=1 Tax=Chitinophaga dinghuensis TaxID=1539050 RepID=A0A327VSE4_9BACT|nr:efflux RND transporter permease subunit [Chitinophaga dinghuensis]RAJ77354.1 multidrug efflux pump subunit AcrB [Chitinophaga dinghuensis]
MYVSYLIKKPVAVFMTFAALLVLGFLAVCKVTVSPLPAVKMPELVVTAFRSNVSTTEMETTVTKLLREQLGMLQQVDAVTSETRDGMATIKVRFQFGVNMEYAYLEANEKVDHLMNGLPKGMDRPKVNKVNTSDLPVFYINISSRSPLRVQEEWELSDFVRQVVKRRLEQLPEVSLADVTGYREPVIIVTPRPSALATLGISTTQFQQILEKNKIAGTTTVGDGVYQYQVRFSEPGITTVEQILNHTFMVQERLLRLRDVADVAMKPQTSSGVFLVNRQYGLNVAILRQGNARIGAVKEQVASLLDKLRKEYPNLSFEEVRDQAVMLDYSIANLWQDLLIGGALAMAVLFLFFRNYRIPLLICISIPVSLLLSMLLLYLCGLSINIVSLAGLALGIGLIIDNTVIVIDNISYYFQQQYSLEEACNKGTMDIIRPLLSSGLTTSSVFFPLIFVSGIAGALFYEQALAVIIAASVSFLVAVTLMPVLYYWLHHSTSKKNVITLEKERSSILERIYERGFKWVFKNKVVTLILVLLLLCGGKFIFRQLPAEQLPATESSEMMIHVNWGDKIQIAENVRRTNILREATGKLLEVFNAEIGTQQYLISRGQPQLPGETNIYLKATSPATLLKAKESIKRIMITAYPSAEVTYTQPETPLEQTFTKSRYNLIVHLKSIHPSVLPAISEVQRMHQSLMTAFPEADIAALPVGHAYKIMINQERLVRYGINPKELRDKVLMMLNGTEVGLLDNSSNAIPVVLAARRQHLEDIIAQEKIPSANGNAVPVKELVRLGSDEGYQTLFGDRSGANVPININTKQPDRIMKAVDELMKAYPELTVSYSGSCFSNQDMISEMMVIAIITVGLLYFILAAQFESLIQPLIVLLELPVSASGALLMLYLAGSSINLMSLIGLIIMSGIIINDSIMKLDTINKLIKEEGYALTTAIHLAGKRRLRAILMTSLITTFSILPFLFGSNMGAVLQRPLSLVIIGGMTLGALVSLYFIPLVYYTYYSRFKMKRIVDQSK